jgi:hypothetical protein
MRKYPTDSDNLSEEEMATEMIELTCDEMGSLAKAFTMLSRLCAELQADIDSEAPLSIPEHEIH